MLIFKTYSCIEQHFISHRYYIYFESCMDFSFKNTKQFIKKCNNLNQLWLGENARVKRTCGKVNISFYVENVLLMCYKSRSVSTSILLIRNMQSLRIILLDIILIMDTTQNCLNGKLIWVHDLMCAIVKQAIVIVRFHKKKSYSRLPGEREGPIVSLYSTCEKWRSS